MDNNYFLNLVSLEKTGIMKLKRIEQTVIIGVDCAGCEPVMKEASIPASVGLIHG